MAAADSQWSVLVIQRAPLNTACEDDPDPDATCEHESTDAPTGWTEADFDDTGWDAATDGPLRDVAPKGGYDEIDWDRASLIWGGDLEVDNTVRCGSPCRPRVMHPSDGIPKAWLTGSSQRGFLPWGATHRRSACSLLPTTVPPSDGASCAQRLRCSRCRAVRRNRTRRNPPTAEMGHRPRDLRWVRDEFGKRGSRAVLRRCARRGGQHRGLHAERE